MSPQTAAVRVTERPVLDQRLENVAVAQTFVAIQMPTVA